MVDDSAEKGRELGVAFAGTSERVDGCLRIGMLDSIGLLDALVDDPAAFVAILFLTVDNLVLADGTVDLGKRKGKVDFSHIEVVLMC